MTHEETVDAIRRSLVVDDAKKTHHGVYPKRRRPSSLDEAFAHAARYDRQRAAAMRLGADPTRCQRCGTSDGHEVAWSDGLKAFLCLKCYSERIA